MGQLFREKGTCCFSPVLYFTEDGVAELLGVIIDIE